MNQILLDLPWTGAPYNHPPFPGQFAPKYTWVGTQPVSLTKGRKYQNIRIRHQGFSSDTGHVCIFLSVCAHVHVCVWKRRGIRLFLTEGWEWGQHKKQEHVCNFLECIKFTDYCPLSVCKSAPGLFVYVRSLFTTYCLPVSQSIMYTCFTGIQCVSGSNLSIHTSIIYHLYHRTSHCSTAAFGRETGCIPRSQVNKHDCVVIYLINHCH